jgi:phosphatidylglycerophosphate synthase
MLRHLPNILSAFRLAAGFAVLVAYNHRSTAQLGVCIVFSILIMLSDFLDGRIARKYSLTTKAGYILDGLADRSVHVSVYLILGVSGLLNLLLAWGLLFREICVYAVRVLNTDWHETMPGVEEWFNKVYVGVVQVLLFVELCREAVMERPASPIYTLLINVVLFSTMAFSYLLIGPKLLRSCMEK